MAGKQITSNIKNKVAVKQIYDYISLEKKTNSCEKLNANRNTLTDNYFPRQCHLH